LVEDLTVVLALMGVRVFRFKKYSQGVHNG